jgi:hypothetical protein
VEAEAKLVHPLLVILITIEDIFLIIGEQRERADGDFLPNDKEVLIVIDR